MHDAHPASDRTIAMIVAVRHILPIFIVSAIYIPILGNVKMSDCGLFEVFAYFKWDKNWFFTFFWGMNL